MSCRLQFAINQFASLRSYFNGFFRVLCLDSKAAHMLANKIKALLALRSAQAPPSPPSRVGDAGSGSGGGPPSLESPSSRKRPAPDGDDASDSDGSDGSPPRASQKVVAQSFAMRRFPAAELCEGFACTPP